MYELFVVLRPAAQTDKINKGRCKIPVSIVCLLLDGTISSLHNVPWSSQTEIQMGNLLSFDDELDGGGNLKQRCQAIIEKVDRKNIISKNGQRMTERKA